MNNALTSLLAQVSGLDVSGIDTDVVIALVAITFVAAIINGAVGYGFSSVTVPSGLLFTTQRLLNPVLVVVEVALNGVSVWINRHGLRGSRPLLLPLTVGLMPGVALGAVMLGVVAVLPLKTVTYALLLPLCLVQLTHRTAKATTTTTTTRTAPKLQQASGAGFGFGLGVLYATTTLSGPPLALFLSRRGLDQDGFRASMAAVRLAESVFAFIAYSVVGLMHVEAFVVAVCIVPSVAVGLPIGRRLAAALSPATFRVLVLGLDVVLITIGLLVSLRQLFGLSVVATVVVSAAAVVVVVSAPLVSFLRRRAHRLVNDVVVVPFTVEPASKEPDVFAAQPS